MSEGKGPFLFRGSRQNIDLGLHRGVWLDVIRHHKSRRRVVDGGNDVGWKNHQAIRGVDVHRLLAPSVSRGRLDSESLQHRGTSSVGLDLRSDWFKMGRKIRASHDRPVFVGVFPFLVLNVECCIGKARDGIPVVQTSKPTGMIKVQV